MELLLLGVLALVAAGVLLVHRHNQITAWDRELEQAFGTTGGRDISHHRRL